jgi:hypothetical protein
MGGRFTKCKYCNRYMDSNTPLFKVYHTGIYNSEYLCENCLIPKIQMIKSKLTVINVFNNSLNFSLLHNKEKKTSRITC